MIDVNEIKTNEEIIEEPVIIAQRYFNIFRQLHIFSNEKKESFNQELSTLSPEIIKALAAIPGGSLLLEYIDEQNGITKATENTFEDIPNSQENTPTPAPFIGSGKISVDESFTQALSLAISKSQDRLLETIRQNPPELVLKSSNMLAANGGLSEIATAFKETQSQIAKMILDFQAQQEAQKNNANNIQINTGPQGYGGTPQLEYDIKGMMAEQMSSLQEITKNHFTELGTTIAMTIKESQEMSSKTITEAIASLSKENMDILKNIINYKIAEGQPQVLEPVFSDRSFINPQREAETKKNSQKLDPVFKMPEAAPKHKPKKEPLFEIPVPKQIKEKFFNLAKEEEPKKTDNNIFIKPEEQDIIAQANTAPKKEQKKSILDDFLFEDDFDLSLDDIDLPEEKPIEKKSQEQEGKSPAILKTDNIAKPHQKKDVPKEKNKKEKIVFEPSTKKEKQKPFKSTINWKEVAEQKKEESLQNPTSPEEKTIDEWGFDKQEEGEDYEWEYVEEDGLEASEEDDYEWEYVEDTGDNDQDYEWEYVEDGDGADYEWEYVEDDEATTKA